MIRFDVPGPTIFRFLLMTSWSVSVILPVTAKVMVSPGLASAMAWRRVPTPLSLVLVTVSVAAIPDRAARRARAQSVKSTRVIVGAKRATSEITETRIKLVFIVPSPSTAAVSDKIVCCS
jgi:hypothetical protein